MPSMKMKNLKEKKVQLKCFTVQIIRNTNNSDRIKINLYYALSSTLSLLN